MPHGTLTREQIEAVLRETGWSKTKAAELLGVPRTTLCDLCKRLGVATHSQPPGLEIATSGDESLLTLRSSTVRTLEGALAAGEVDLAVWEVERWVLNKWDSVAKVSRGPRQEREEQLQATELWQVKVWLRRKSGEVRSIEALLEELAGHRLKLPKPPKPKKNRSGRRALEICVMDPHLGMECFRPGADHAWDLDTCERYYLDAVASLLAKAEHYGPFEEIVWLFGNDYLHCDTVFHETTAGTGQPEAVSYHAAYERGIKLALAAAEMLRQSGPLTIIQVSGNHDRVASFTLGHVLRAFYHNTKGVEVDVSPSPYKFWEFGQNLVGFDHGHQKNVARLAALMANERPAAWARTSFREWHLGDQHRKGSGRPTLLSESGCNVEFLTGLTPANEWHRIKTFNHQQRGATAFVWDAAAGQIARLNWNVDLYTGRPMAA